MLKKKIREGITSVMNEESVSKEYRAFLEFLYSTESKALHGTLKFTF